MSITISTDTAMRALRKCRSWDPQMSCFIFWDEDDQSYVGEDGDFEELCRDIDPSRFLQLFKEATDE